MAEFIPFGANQMVELNHHVGATERVQGGFLTANVDENSSGKGVKVMHPALYASLSMPVHTVSASAILQALSFTWTRA